MGLLEDLHHIATRSISSTRQERAQMAYEMYCGDHEAYIERNPDEDPREFVRRPKEWLNITRLVIDILSGLYTGTVHRTVHEPRESGLVGRMARLWRANAMDTFMLHIDRLVRTVGTVAVRAFYDETQGEIAYWAYPGHMVDAVADPDRPWHPLGAVVRWAETDAAGRIIRRAHLWTETEFADVTDARMTGRRQNTYGRVPLAFLCDAPPRIAGLFPPGRGWDLAEANAVLDTRLSDDLYTLKMQGFGVAEVVNPLPGQDLVLSPGRALVFDQRPGEEAGIQFKNPGAPLEALAGEIKDRIKRILLTHRIPESAITVSLSGTSGVAIRAAHTPLETDRAERARLFAAYEHDLLRLSARVLNVHEPGADYAEDATLAVNYPESAIADPTERRAQREFELRHGITTPWRIAAQDNPDRYVDPSRPDVSAEQIAREEILENRRALPAPDAADRS